MSLTPLELSADTARLAVTPAPAGKPGGPGLYHVAGMQLPPYFQHVRDALIRSGHTTADAYRITWGAIRRWAHGGGSAHPEVVAAAKAALADLKAKAAVAHSHANEDGGAMALTWNGQSLDLASIDLGGYLPPHVPAGSPTGGQFGTTSGGSSAAKPGKAPTSAKAKAAAAATARKAALHAQAKKLRVQAAAITAQIAGINATIALQVKASAAAAAKPKASAAAKAAAAVKKAATTSAAATKAKTAAKKARKPTLAQNRATVTGLHSKVHALLSQANALDAQANAIKLSNDGGSPFLDLAFAEALADRVPPGRPEGGQFTPAVVQLTRHDTPAMAARAVNAMGPEQRAMVRASTLPPPGFAWGPADRLSAAELALAHRVPRLPAVSAEHRGVAAVLPQRGPADLRPVLPPGRVTGQRRQRLVAEQCVQLLAGDRCRAAGVAVGRECLNRPDDRLAVLGVFGVLPAQFQFAAGVLSQAHARPR